MYPGVHLVRGGKWNVADFGGGGYTKRLLPFHGIKGQKNSCLGRTMCYCVVLYCVAFASIYTLLTMQPCIGKQTSATKFQTEQDSGKRGGGRGGGGNECPPFL